LGIFRGNAQTLGLTTAIPLSSDRIGSIVEGQKNLEFNKNSEDSMGDAQTRESITPTPLDLDRNGFATEKVNLQLNRDASVVGGHGSLSP